MRIAMTLTLAAAALLALPGCLPGGMTLPEHFVAVDKTELGDYAVRGISADGVVVGLRVQDNMTNGTLEFWAKAIQNEMTGRGYQLDKIEEVASAAGKSGRLMTFSVRSRGAPFTYYQALYVVGSRVLVAEAGGKTEAIESRKKDIRASILSVR